MDVVRPVAQPPPRRPRYSEAALQTSAGLRLQHRSQVFIVSVDLLEEATNSAAMAASDDAGNAGAHKKGAQVGP